MATLPRGTTDPVGVRHATGARLHLQGGNRTRQATKSGARQTSDSAAAPGAAGVHPRPLPPETEAPARPSPHTTDRTPRETGRVLTALTPTAELAAAHAATHLSAKEEEIPPASWRLVGSPALGSGRSHTTGPVLHLPAMTAARHDPAAATAAATAATAAAEATVGATAGVGAGAGATAGVAARAGAGVAAGAAPTATTATTAAAATAARDSDHDQQDRRRKQKH